MIFAYGQINYTAMTFFALSANRAIAVAPPKIYPHKGMLFILMVGAFVSSFHHLIGGRLLQSKNLTIILSASYVIGVTVISYGLISCSRSIGYGERPYWKLHS